MIGGVDQKENLGGTPLIRYVSDLWLLVGFGLLVALFPQLIRQLSTLPRPSHALSAVEGSHKQDTDPC